MKRKKNTVALLLAFVLLMSLCACGQDEYHVIELQQQSATPQTDGENTRELLTLGLTDDVGNLHPLFSTSTQMVSLNHLIFEGLFEADTTGQAQHCLAKDYSYRANTDGTVTWTVEISPNVPWHGGLGTVSAQDAAYTIQTIMTYGGFYKDRVAGFVSATAVDAETLSIVTDRYYPDMPEKLVFPIIPQSYYAGKESSQPTPMGCGAYYVEQMGEGSDFMVLRAFEDRWRQMAQIDEIHVQLYHDSSTLIEAYRTGEIQVALTNETVTGQALGAGKGRVYTVASNRLEVLVPNTAKAPMDDVALRQAIGYAINKNDIMTLLYAKRAMDVDLPIFTGHFLDSAMSHRYDYNVQMARTILKEAGYHDYDLDGFLDGEDGKPLTLRLVTNDVENNTLRRQTANLIGEALAQVGIKVEVQEVEFSDISNILKNGDYDLLLTGIVTPYAPEAGFLYEQSLNGYSSPTIDAALQRIDSAKDRTLWLEANESAQQVLLDEYPIMPLFYRCNVLIADEEIQGVDPQGETDALYNMVQWCVVSENN